MKLEDYKKLYAKGLITHKVLQALEIQDKVIQVKLTTGKNITNAVRYVADMTNLSERTVWRALKINA